ncbi:SPOR domain-containing protein [Brucella sp. TWI432]
MTDSSANSRNYGERPLHEDDPLMELSRIMDFGAPADNNIARNNDAREPNFDSADDALSFDLERELLGDFGDVSEPEEYAIPFSQSPSYDTPPYQSAEPQRAEDDLALALDEELDLGLDANEQLSPGESYEFVESVRSDASAAYVSQHVAQDDVDYRPAADQQSEAPYGDAYLNEPELNAAFGDNWEIPSAEPFERSAAGEPVHQSLSLEDELENLLFSDEPRSTFENQSTYGNQPEQAASFAPRYEDSVAEAPSYAEPARYTEAEPVFDNSQLEDPQAYEPVEQATSFAPESYDAPQSTSQEPVYPHYTLSNFAPGGATAGVLSAEPVRAAHAGYEDEPIELADDFSFDEDFSLESEQGFTSVAAEATEDELSGLDDISFNEDDFGFEASGDVSSPPVVEDENIFTEEDFFIEDDLDLAPEIADEPVYAHATYNEQEQTTAPSFTNYADPRSTFAAPAPEIETLSVADSKVEQTHSLDLPDVNYGEEDPAASLTDLEAEFAEVFSTIDVDDTAAKTEVQSEADRAFEDIFRESASSYLPNAGVAAGAALGAGAAAAAYGRYSAPQDTVSGTSASQDDFYNHWAAQGAQTIKSEDLGTRASMQPEDDLGRASEAYLNRPVRGRRGLILASVAGIAVLIGGIGYHFIGGSGSGEPVVIRADNQPIKVQPENPGGATVPNQDKAVYDRVAGTLPNSPEQQTLISSGEEPVDLGAQDNDVGTNDSPEPNQSAEAPASSGQDAPLIKTREVQTMIVRPDGTIVQPQEQEPAPKQATATNDSSPIAPPAETDEIAAIAAGSQPPQSTVNTPAAQPAPTVQTQAAPAVRAPVVPSRPAAQPTTIVGNVPQRTPAAAPAAAQVASAAGGGYFIQIASQPSAELAQKSYANMAQRYGSVIGGRAVDIKRADIPNKGTYYRVRVQAGSKEEANALCARFKSAGGSCFVTQ